jgi:glycosyltransferase involved in cell wall biosynthesis
MLSKDTLISIVICTHNNSSILDRALDRLSRQHCPEGLAWEVLVVDNNCTDGTQQVVERHRSANRLRRLRVVSEYQQGLTPARQRGVRETSGEWLAFVDDDCLLAESWLANAMCFATGHPRCGALGGVVRPYWESGAEPLPDTVGWALACQDHGPQACRVWSLVGAGLIVRRAALEETGWIHTPLLADRIGQRLVSGGDTEIGIRISASGWDLWYTPDCVIDHLIPARRTSPGYLRRLAFGLGISQVLVDALIWEQGFVSCVGRCALSASSRTLHAIEAVIRDRIRGRDRRPSSINLHFALGSWAGIGCLAYNRSLVGAVRRSHHHPSTSNP